MLAVAMFFKIIHRHVHVIIKRVCEPCELDWFKCCECRVYNMLPFVFTILEYLSHAVTENMFQTVISYRQFLRSLHFVFCLVTHLINTQPHRISVFYPPPEQTIWHCTLYLAGTAVNTLCFILVTVCIISSKVNVALCPSACLFLKTLANSTLASQQQMAWVSVLGNWWRSTYSHATNCKTLCCVMQNHASHGHFSRERRFRIF